MDDHDQQLKNIVRNETQPKLPPLFIGQTLRRLQLPAQKVHHLNGDSLALIDWVQSHKWWLIGAVIFASALALQQQRQSSTDEDLFQIDTLSMSSFSVL
jgi:DNA polymerase III psi subunit